MSNNGVSQAIARIATAVFAAIATISVATSAMAQTPPVRHVFVVVLENQSYAVTFGPKSPAPYLAHTLPTRGALLSQYYGVGHASLELRRHDQRPATQ